MSNGEGLSVATMAGRRWCLNFRRFLNERLQSQLVDLQSRLMWVALNEEKDRPKMEMDQLWDFLC